MSSLFDDIDLCVKIYNTFPGITPDTAGFWSCEACDDEHMKLNGTVDGYSWAWSDLQIVKGHTLCDSCYDKMVGIGHDFMHSQKEENGGP